MAIVLSATQAGAQNVGIGTSYPNNGKLVIKTSSTTSALVVGDSTNGISFCEVNSPTINFNTYYRSGRKLMDDGFASYFFFNTGNGTLYYNNSEVTGTQGGTPSLSNKFTITKEGNVGIGSGSPTEGLQLRGKNIRIENTSGIRTIQINSFDGSSGEMIFYDPTDNTSTLEIDGDYGGTGRSRIIVDELQIKGGADFAEYFDIAPALAVKPEPGMLVSIDEKNEGKLIVSNTAYDKKVAGIISGANGIKPGMMMGHKGTVANGEHPVAITGRVYVKAEAFSHSIRPGDLLTSSAITGHAMKAAHSKRSQGAIIGKAMSSLDAGTKGMVLVLLGIQ